MSWLNVEKIGCAATKLRPEEKAENPQDQSFWKQLLTLEMVSGMLKSFPPCSLKPQGPGPASDTL